MKYLNMRSNSSTARSAMVEYLLSTTPAELTSMWTGELYACSAASKSDFTCAGSDTSALMDMAEFGEEELISAATVSAAVELEV